MTTERGRRRAPAVPGALLYSDTAVLLAVVGGARMLDEVAAAADLPRMTCYGSLRRLRRAGLVDWEDRRNGTLHALVKESPLRACV